MFGMRSSLARLSNSETTSENYQPLCYGFQEVIHGQTKLTYSDNILCLHSVCHINISGDAMKTQCINTCITISVSLTELT